jgi:1,4-dihydroxy-2-naphthoate octaprenyltransferase
VATAAQWLEGARPRTLPAALSPVLAGSGAAWWLGGFHPWRALLALVVALALQVGVNYANDYSDGVRGTDAERVGPMRLVGSGAATPGHVKLAAFACFGIAAVAGLALVVWTAHWWLLAVGAASILAAWYYTGGDRPYGYAGLGELFVFVFFGLVAVCGTTYVQVGIVDWATLAAAVAVGALACAILVANNLRDIAGDTVAGKRTLAVRMGDTGTRRFYVALVAVTALAVGAAGAMSTWWALLGLAGLVLLVRPARDVLDGAVGKALIGVLKLTGFAELAVAGGLAVGWWLGR